MVSLFRFLSHFPLGLLHAMGAVAGWLVYLFSGRYRARWQANVQQAGLTQAQSRAAIAHNGRMMLELPRLWMGKPLPYIWQDISVVEQAFAAGKGVVFLSPHLGAFETVPQIVASHFSKKYGSLTVMYRPARQRWMEAMLKTVRERPGVRTVPTTLAGIRQMIRELRQGRGIGILPDHVPPEGQGVWAPFFGKPAYSMTLAAKLVQQTGAEVVAIWGERLPHGSGYRLHCQRLPEPLSADLPTAVSQINAAMERLILSAPEQYMWSYARYRQPRPQPTSPVVQAIGDAPESGHATPPPDSTKSQSSQ